MRLACIGLLIAPDKGALPSRTCADPFNSTWGVLRRFLVNLQKPKIPPGGAPLRPGGREWTLGLDVSISTVAAVVSKDSRVLGYIRVPKRCNPKP